MSNDSASTASLENTPASVQVVETPTTAHYYEILDRAGKRRAGLMVMLDSQQRATRAELCYYERYHALEPVQEEIFDQAVEIVENNYLGNGLSSELAVIDGTPMAQETVRHSNPDPLYRPDRRTRIWPYAAGYAALIVVLLLLGLLNRTLFRPTVTVDQIADAAPLLTSQSDALPAAEAPVAAGALAALPPDALQATTNGLPVSLNANDALAVGMKARIGAGLRSFVRSEPGPEAGDKVGFLEDGATATILGGPTWLPGDTDTIVWWYVETEDGIRGWTPANTSQLTLLEPVE
ncbi:SH3 domain-containing protein [Caldilinea sp.]|uniref:SH3 domain-containing protein n=1 Tax=Caldilinea sp. TaxID=2293560 RepID=UPI002BEE1433|nr:SH3 domain-containing protein [Caldilinea sp.]